MRRLLVSAAAIAALMASVTFGFAQTGPVVLEFKGDPGSKLRYSSAFDMNLEMTVSQPGGGLVITLEPSLAGRAVTETRVVNVAENGDLTLATKVESFDVSLDFADLHARLAITGPDGKPPVLFKLPELPFQMVMTKQGKPLSVQGLDALLAKIPSPPGQKIDFGKLMAKSLSDFAQPVFPDRPVSVGDSWGYELVVDPMEIMKSMGTPVPPEAESELAKMRFPIHCTSKLVAFEMVDGVACAQIEAQAPWEVSMPVGPPGEAQASFREQGTSKVTTWFDYAAGRKVREQTEVSLDMNVTMGSETLMKMAMKATGERHLQ